LENLNFINDMAILKIKHLLFPATIIFVIISCSEPVAQRETSFNSGWKFIRSEVDNGQLAELNDADWRILDLPHDYSIEDLPEAERIKQIGPFSEKSAGGASTGHMVGGTAWYRKHFTLGKKENGKLIKVLFDGVYMDTEVWINGHHLGLHPYGYTAFYFDLTEFLNPPGKDNVLAVRVNNKGKNSRWYSGSGIYRDVKLIKTDPLHIGIWGVSLSTPETTTEKAVVKISAKIINATLEKEDFDLVVQVKDRNGNTVASCESKVEFNPGETRSIDQQLEISYPSLWSPASPYLYSTVVELVDDGKTSDQVEEKFGIRSLEFSAEKGFLLNGLALELQGGCLHHDNGPLGSAAFRTAEFRRVKTMKENGFNAIRTAHNPPSKLLLDACDELGMFVMDESFDHWQKPKNPQDYHRFFVEWWEKDIGSMVLRDRNHPSVIIWSVGNEIQERADSSGLAIFKMLADKVRSVDPSGRPVTQAICEFWDNRGRPWEDTAPAFGQTDVHGYNYQWKKYETDHAKFTERIIIGTESVPKEAFENWQLVEKHPYVIGDFVWTGMDYLGESGIGHTKYEGDSIGFLPPWPWYVANCGDISILGDKKPQMYYRDVVWKNSPLEMMVHAPLPEGRKEIVSFWGWPEEWKCWNWPGMEGKRMQVSVYTRCDQVRLELNGKVLETKEASDKTKLTAQFDVPYQPGELVAVGISGGKEVARQVLKTAGKPYQIKVTPEKEKVDFRSDDLAYFNIEIQDEKGQTVPNFQIPINFEISGGKLQAVANSNPRDMHSFQQPKVNTFRGKCQVIVRVEKSGKIMLYAKAEGMKEGTGSVKVQ
jgi:beta-galactosidase